MVESIDKLTERIYTEGVEKAKAEAQKILVEAEEKRVRIIGAGKDEAEGILLEARRQADELKKTADTEVRMAAQKSLAALRQKIEGLITASVSDDASAAVARDGQFLKKIIEKLIDQWDSTDHALDALVIKLSGKDTKELSAHFSSKAREKMKEKISVLPDQKIKAGFVIEPADGSFRIGFTDEDFAEFFRFFLRPRIKKFLFGETGH